MPRPTWFWVLLPKQKACPEFYRRSLGCRAEIRHFIEQGCKEERRWIPVPMAAGAGSTTGGDDDFNGTWNI